MASFSTSSPNTPPTAFDLPVIRFDPAAGLEPLDLDGPWARFDAHGRCGLKAGSVRSRWRIPHHTVKQRQGSLVFWVMPFEDLGPVPRFPHLDQHEKDYEIHPLLSDTAEVRNRAGANFQLRYTTDWWRNLSAQFIALGDEREGHKACIAPDHLTLRGGVWYQLGVSWDRDAGRYRLFVNGVRVDAESPWVPYVDAPCGETLYAGTTAFALGALEFYGHAGDDDAFVELYARQRVGGRGVDEVDRDLRRMFEGEGLAPFSWSPDESWGKRVELSLTEPEQAECFYVQGQHDAHAFTDEGLVIQTSDTPPWKGAFGYNRCENYLWLEETFEGDIAVEFDFQVRRPNGLALIMFHASGMQREDFMADYERRTNGSMGMVCWENVRNYHWEFYREIDNCRNDCESHLLVKNPWMAGLAYQCRPDHLKRDEWHRLRLVQEGRRLRGAIDGVCIFDVVDAPDTYTGPAYHFGRFALRCKYKTHMVFRNLVVWTRPPSGWVVLDQTGDGHPERRVAT